MVQSDSQSRGASCFVDSNIVDAYLSLIIVNDGDFRLICSEDDIIVAGLNIAEVDQKNFVRFNKSRIDNLNGNGFGLLSCVKG